MLYIVVIMFIVDNGMLCCLQLVAQLKMLYKPQENETKTGRTKTET
jgi:hypothetical protein